MKKIYIIIASLISCIILYFVEQVLTVNYITKTITKVMLFTAIPYFYYKFINTWNLNEVLNFKRPKSSKPTMGIIFGVISFFVIITAYIILKDYIDLDGIAYELQYKSKITPSNFILIGVYITIVNSLLEEFFFRGFIFLNLYKQRSKKTAYIYSSLLFGLYHIAIFKSWFSIQLMGLALFGLISVGFIFSWLDIRTDNFISSWIVHILADSAIIIIGMSMFDFF